MGTSREVGDPMRQIVSGDPMISSAKTFNSMLAAQRYVKDRARQTPDPRSPVQHERQRIRIHNTSESDIDRWHILGIDGLVFDREDNITTFEQQPCFKGVVPRRPDHAGAFVVALEPIGPDKLGWALLSGLVTVQVKLKPKYKSLPCAGIIDDDATMLELCATSKADVLYIEPTTYEEDALPDTEVTKWALIQMTARPPNILRVTLDEDLVGSEAGEPATLAAATVLDHLGQATDQHVPVCTRLIGSGQQLDSGATLIVAGIEADGNYEVVTGPCPSPAS